MELKAEEILKAVGGRLEKEGSATAIGLSIDTRTIDRGDVFFALKGPHHDGHRFLQGALEKGASGLVISGSFRMPENLSSLLRESGETFVIRVRDTLRALGDLASFRRSRFEGKVIAVTGSNGKTTTKEMIASILAVRWNVGKSPGNYNNLVGVPLSIFGQTGDNQALVLEIGMNRPGEIGRLTEITAPDIGVLTSIAPAHLLYLKDIEGIKKAKGELLRKMGSRSVAVLNADDKNVMSLTPDFKGRVMTFAARPGADIWAERMVALVDGRTSFSLVAGDEKVKVAMNFLGQHNIYNALAAAAVGLTLGFDLKEVEEGLARCQPLPMRLETVTLAENIKLINDAYNANPGSVKAAVETFFNIVVRGRHLVLLGDMLELGEHSSQAHEEIGRFMAERGVDLLITVGEESKEASRAFAKVHPSGRSPNLAGTDEAAELLVEELKEGDALLIKASRGMGLEKVVERMVKLMENLAADHEGGR